MAALANAIEAVARRHNPGVRRRPFAILPKILEDSRVLRGHRREVIERFVSSGRQTRRGHVVAQNSLVHNLREERRPWDPIPQQVRHVFLPFRSERFVFARTTAKGDPNTFSVDGGGRCACKRRSAKARAYGKAGSTAKK